MRREIRACVGVVDGWVWSISISILRWSGSWMLLHGDEI